MVTPFHADGSVDYESLSDLLHLHMDNGTDFLCVLGSTAETPCLTSREKLDVKNFVVDIVKGKMPILLGFGGNSTSALVSEIKEFDFRGVDGILSVVPFYNKPSQEGMFQHFMAVAAAVPDVPVVLYNVPGRTGVNMLPETTIRIARDADNVVAIKEASGNVEQIAEIISNAPEGFEVLSGDDSIACSLIERGAVGVISVVGNAIPKKFSTMVHLKLEGKSEEAEAINSSLAELYHLVFVDGNPAGIKALLSNMAKCENVLRLPLVPARPQTIETLKVFA